MRGIRYKIEPQNSIINLDDFSCKQRIFWARDYKKIHKTGDGLSFGVSIRLDGRVMMTEK
jgi:hypothetical protein